MQILMQAAPGGIQFQMIEPAEKEGDPPVVKGGWTMEYPAALTLAQGIIQIAVQTMSTPPEPQRIALPRGFVGPMGPN